MSIPKDETPKSIEVEVEVPGTPEQVWDAIATGPGITAWFAPAEIEGCEGGTVAFDMGSGSIEASGQVTAWDPLHRYMYEEEWQPVETQPAGVLATEWLVEARSESTCVVRVVANAFTRGGDWSDELDQMKEGWTAFLHNLRLYLTNFPGQPCSPLSVTGSAREPLTRTWAQFSEQLGISGAAQGDTVHTAGASPRLAGVVERVIDGHWHAGLMVRTEAPAPGVALVFVYGWRGETHPVVSLYLFGGEAPAVVTTEKPAWRAWMDEHFPAVAEADAKTG